MSWLATSPSLAPPIETTTANNFFGNQSSQTQQTTRFRTISLTSASHHLARQKSEMESGDDTMSLKSYRSSTTLTGNSRAGGGSSLSNGGGTVPGRNQNRERESRSRGTSNASSYASRITERMEVDNISVKTSNSSRPPSPASSNQPIDRPEALEGGTVPPVIKRQKLLQEERRPTSQQQQQQNLPRSTSWFGALDWRAGASISSSSDNSNAQEVLIDSESISITQTESENSTQIPTSISKPIIRTTSKPPKFTRAISSKSSSSIHDPSPTASTSSIPFPSIPTSSSTSTLVPPSISPASTLPPATSSTETSSINSNVPTPRVRTTSTMSSKQSWFGPSFYADEREKQRARESSNSNSDTSQSEALPRSPSPVSQVSFSPAPLPPVESLPIPPTLEPIKDSNGSAFLEVPGAEQERLKIISRNKEKALQLQSKKVGKSKKEEESMMKNSWMASISKYAGLDLGKVVLQEEPNVNKMDVDEAVVPEVSNISAMTQAQIEPSIDSQATIKATALKDDSTVTLKSVKRQIPSANQRLSWWNWTPPTESTIEESLTPPIVESVPEPTVEVSTPVVEPFSPIVQVTSKQIAERPKTWYRTVWGDSASEIAERVKAAAAEEQLALKLAATTLEAAQVAKKAKELEMLPPPIPTTNSKSNSSNVAEEGQPRSLPLVQALKHKASWAFFPSSNSRGSSSITSDERASTAPTTPAPSIFNSETTQAQPIPRSSTPLATNSDNRGRSSIAKSVSLLSKSPRNGYPVVASSASSRASSRGDPNTISAPNSPLLRAVQDQPLKPLTGSIKSSPRITTQELDTPIENLVLPTFSDTFSRPPRSFPMKKSKLTKVVSVMSSYWFSQPTTSTGNSEVEEIRGQEMMKHDPAERLPKSFEKMGEVAGRLDKINRVVTIGVHGWFPNPRLKSVFGEPTGTSRKFTTMMNDAVQDFLESHDKSSFNIQAIALEGEGKVSDRVDLLYSQLLARVEWIEALKKADAVFIATHSQGTIVSTHLIDRMLNDGLIDGSKVHLLAMCGIFQGPFVYLSQSYTLTPYFNFLESDAARELFEYQDPQSVVSRRFLESMNEILSCGVKITTVGSINDQVVPLYSALFAGVSHPAILRAVYIDSDAFKTSDFLANLVVFAARLQNGGLSDHDLLYHLSEALAGALTGVGHSKIYEEEEVFNLAVRYHFETTPLNEAPTFLNKNATLQPLHIEFNPKDRRNPYLLTWSLRGIVEDPQVRELFGKELGSLRSSYESWKPTTKILKEVKLKLEGIRSLSIKNGKL